MGVFDELIEVFGDDVMTARDYLTLISSAFSQLTLAFIPPTLDQVLVSSIERSRHPDLKAVFLIGATQKHFPIPVATDSILTDSDRRVVESMDFVLAPAADRRLREQQYLTYIAFTRPAELLYVTYPLVDDKASAVQRSQFVTELESLFTDLEAEPVPSEQPDIEDITIEAELCDLLCCRLGRDASDSHSGGTDRLMRFLNDASSDERFGRLASMVLRAVEYGNHAELDTDVVAELFGPALSSSATRLSSFAACPYQHFAGHILELKQRKECRLEPLDIGLFYHRLLDILFRRIVDSGKDIATIGDEQLVGLLREEIQKYIEHDSFISNFVRHSAHNDFLIRLGGEYLEDCVLAIARMVRAGGFRPVLSEIAFGRAKGAGDSLGDYRIELSDGRILYLNGRIDRIDVAEVAGERFAIVFDYKRKAMSFDWSKFYHGLDMQLPVYMLAVGATGHSQLGSPVGGFFMPVEVKPGSASPDELSAKAEKFRHKATGIFNGEFAARLDREAVKDSIFYNFYVTKDNRPYGYYGKRGALQPRDFKKILSFTERRIKEIAEEMYSGRIDIRPYKIGTKSPCILCKYKSLCRFDWQINDYRFLESPDKTGVLERIGPTDG